VAEASVAQNVQAVQKVQIVLSAIMRVIPGVLRIVCFLGLAPLGDFQTPEAEKTGGDL
jgi:hypothetical protein